LTRHRDQTWNQLVKQIVDGGWQLKIFGRRATCYICRAHQPRTMQDIMNSKTEHLLECVMPSCPTPVVRESFLLTRSLLLVLLASIVVTALLGGLGLLPPHTAGAAATEWRGQGKVNVLLRVEADHEGGNVDDLLANTVVLLAMRVERRFVAMLTGCGAGG
jgi:hypothetical protein